ncbi:MAG: hypothetical protein ABWY11_06785 [Umezawaea sp.]
MAAETGLRITVCHFPPGTSKWTLRAVLTSAAPGAAAEPVCHVPPSQVCRVPRAGRRPVIARPPR